MATAPGLGFSIASDYIAATSAFSVTDEINIKVYVESYDDRRLWSHIFNIDQFNNNQQGRKIKLEFLPPSIEGKANGKTSLLTLIKNQEIILGENLLLCVDSDFDYIIGDKAGTTDRDIVTGEFAFETYYYAAENHYYTPDGLLTLCENAVCGHLDYKFSFTDFAQRWSAVMFPVFSSVLFFKKLACHDEFKQYKQRMNAVLKAAFPTRMNVQHWEQYIETLRQSLELLKTDIEKDTHFNDNDFTGFLAELDERGLNENNTYCFYRGHDLEDIVLKPICNSIKNTVVSNYRSALHNTVKDPKTRENNQLQFENQLADPIQCIKNRTSYNDNPVFAALQTQVADRLIKYHY